MSSSDTLVLAIARLSRLLDVLNHTEALVQLEPDALSPEERGELHPLRERVQRQLEKLRRGEFHVAVVGLEKAGKSTFLNAWLKQDLLPNRQERCTYATTELRSAEEQGNHRLRIEYLKREEFEAHQRDYEAKIRGGGSDGSAAAADLDEIRQHRTTIEERLGRPVDEMTFPSLEAMQPDLERFVANPAIARALRSVTISSAQLYHRAGIIFHDVPGYDSPISMHRELAKQELARADAILFVTNLAATVSLTRQQLDMLDVADSEDPEIKSYDKLFVFLNKIDATAGKADFEKRFAQAKNELSKGEGARRCNPERIIPGSAGAYLLAEGSPVRADTKLMLESVPSRLDQLDPPLGSGIEHLRKQVEQYLEHERSRVLARRCDALILRGHELGQHALTALAVRYPTSPKELEIEERVGHRIAIRKWLDAQWKHFEQELATYWIEEVMPSKDVDAPSELPDEVSRVLHEGYIEALKSLKIALAPDKLRSTLIEIHTRIRDEYPSPVKANQALRSLLRKQVIAPELERVTKQMSATFWRQIEGIQSRVQAVFFGLEGVRSQVYPQTPKTFQARINHGLATLFLRYARPCLPLMIAEPRGREFREPMMKRYRHEAQALQSFYDNEKHPERADLLRFLLTIVEIGVEITAGPTASKIPSIATTMLEGVGPKHAAGKIADTMDAVLNEIIEDSDLFLDYLEHAVYHAAGFEQYYMAELLSVRQHLIGEHSEQARDNIFRELETAIERRDTHLPAEVLALSDTSRRRHVVEALGRLRTSIEAISITS